MNFNEGISSASTEVFGLDSMFGDYLGLDLKEAKDFVEGYVWGDDKKLKKQL